MKPNVSDSESGKSDNRTTLSIRVNVEDFFIEETSNSYRLVQLLKELSYTGAIYLLELVQKPDTSIHCTYLRNGLNIDKSEFLDKINDKYDNYELKDFNFSCAPQWDRPIEAADKKAVSQVFKTMCQYQEAYDICSSQNNIARAEELKLDILKMKEWLHDTVNRRGRIKKLANQALKDYHVVHKALIRIVKRIGEIDPELGRLCDRHLVYGMTPCWRSDPIK